LEKPQSDTPEFGTGNIGVVAPPLPREQTKEWIYVLECEHGCYYVGKTKKNPSERLEEHRSGKGAAWTCLHKPLSGRGFYRPPRLVRVGNEDSAGLDEDMETKLMMKEHGIEFVRGGSHMQPILAAEVTRMLKRELNHDANGCLHCGGKDHFVKDCPKKYQASSSSLPPCSKKRKPVPPASCYSQTPSAKKKKPAPSSSPSVALQKAISNRAKSNINTNTKKEKKSAPEAVVEKNQGLVECFWELSSFAFKDSNVFLGTSNKKIAKALAALDYKITSGKDLTKKKTKVAGIGMNSAVKIDEYLKTGVMVCLEEKRSQHA
jgi:hypothetical protein